MSNATLFLRIDTNVTQSKHKSNVGIVRTVFTLHSVAYQIRIAGFYVKNKCDLITVEKRNKMFDVTSITKHEFVPIQY